MPHWGKRKTRLPFEWEKFTLLILVFWPNLEAHIPVLQTAISDSRPLI